MHAQAQSPGNVAIVDLAYIFEQHQGFKVRSDALKGEAETAEAVLKREGEALRQLVDKLNEFKPGSPEYKQMEEEIAKREADLKVKLHIQRKEFIQKEAKVYYTVYQEIFQEVQAFCQANGIMLVLRFDGNSIDPDNPPEVVKQMQKLVVYNDRQIDITPIILERLARRQPTAQVPGNQGVRQPPAGIPPRR
jgi:outer membrane protein